MQFGYVIFFPTNDTKFLHAEPMIRTYAGAGGQRALIGPAYAAEELQWKVDGSSMLFQHGILDPGEHRLQLAIHF